jgi:hypothetical protein
MIDQNVPHQLCGDAEKVGPVLPVRLTVVHQLEVGLVD